MIKSIKTFVSKIVSFCKKYAFLISVCFALFFCIYNGVLGFYKNVIWNIAIFTYYLLLLTIRMILYVREKKSKKEDEKDIKRDKQIYISTSVIMFIMNLAMILPASLLINHQKEVNLSLISAIAVAAYTTYKVTLAIIKFCKVQKQQNLIYKQVRMVNLFDAVMSILTLQNTLTIVASDGNNSDMYTLSIITTIAMLLTISIISIYTFKKNLNINLKTRTE